MTEIFNYQEWLKQNNIPVAKLCKESGISLNTYYKLIKGDSMRESTVRKVDDYISKIDGNVYFNKKEKYVPKLLDVDDVWRFLTKEIKCICADKNGFIYGSTSTKIIPNRSEGFWDFETPNQGRFLPICLNIKMPSDWTNSKIERPVNFWEFVGKYGLFSDNSSKSLMFGKLEGINDSLDCPFKMENGFAYQNFRPLNDIEKGNLC